MKTKYSIKILELDREKKDEDLVLVDKEFNNRHIARIVTTAQYFSTIKNDEAEWDLMSDRCRPIEVLIISDEEIKKGDSYFNRRRNMVLTCDSIDNAKASNELGDKKVIGKAPKNIIDDLISGKKKVLDEVEVGTTPIFDDITLEDGQNFLVKVPAIVLNPDGTIMCK